jgi:hypothetical protein
MGSGYGRALTGTRNSAAYSVRYSAAAVRLRRLNPGLHQPDQQPPDLGLGGTEPLGRRLRINLSTLSASMVTSYERHVEVAEQLDGLTQEIPGSAAGAD